jgi:hypothetical protein
MNNNIDIKRLAANDGIAAVLAVPYEGARADIREALGPLDIPAGPTAIAIRVLLDVASLPDLAGSLRCVLDDYDLTVVVVPNDAEREVVAVVLKTGHPVVKSLRRSIKRCWAGKPPRRSLAGLVYPSDRDSEATS